MQRSFLLEPGFQFSAALDPHRRAAFTQAIEHALAKHSGDVSIAFLGWQAATLIDLVHKRAQRIVIVEDDPEFVDALQHGLVSRGFGTNVTIIHEAPADVVLDDRVDIAVSCHVTPWLLEGPAAQKLSNARQHVLKPGGTMIPRKGLHLFELLSVPNDINGIAVRTPRYGRPGEPFPVLSESKHFITTDFEGESETRFDVEDTVFVKPLVSGTLTALKLTTLVEFSESVVHLAGHSGFQSVVMPLREDLEVQASQPVKLFMRYSMGEGLKTTRFMARRVYDSTPKSSLEDSLIQEFQKNVSAMIDAIDELGRGADLDKVVSYTVDPHGDVSRLTALFWTIDEEFRKPVRDLVEKFKRSAGERGATPDDETIYQLMVDTYHEKRALT